MKLHQMLDRLSSSPPKLEARQRQVAVWKNQPVDRLPLLFGVPTGLNGQRYNLEECYFDKEKMLIEALHESISFLESPGDAVPSVRVNTGTGTLATVFGLNQEVFPDKMPWLHENLSKGQISAFEPDLFEDVSDAGVMPMVLEYQRFFQGNLPPHVGVFLSDTQSPFDIAHLVRGTDIFTDMYDDPPFVHHLLELTTTVYINATKAMKENLGESFDEAHHIGGLYIANGAVRVCEDTPVILSPGLIDEFVLPYTERALGAFGGGYVHYCGRNDHLFKMAAQIPVAHGFNFGMPEQQDMQLVMDELLARDKVYYGEWTRKPDEPLAIYFERIMTALNGRKKGLILTPTLTRDELDRPQEIVETWEKYQ